MAITKRCGFIAIVAVMAILLCSQVSGQLYSGTPLYHNQRAGKIAPYCQSFPLPSVSPGDILSNLQSDIAAADMAIQNALKKYGPPVGGVVVNLVYRDTVLWTKGYGAIDMSDPTKGPPTRETAFRIGSITKVLTSLMTLILRDQRSLRSLDANVSEYLTEFSIKNPFETKRGVTFRQLMSHMSGLPRAPPCEDLFVTGCNLTDDDIYKNLADIELLYPPGEQPLYSNLGFGLLGRALEKVTKSRWEQAVKQIVFDPLGMTNSGNNLTIEDIKKVAYGYYPNGAQAGFISLGWDSPAGQTYASADDLAKLMMLVFRSEQTVNSQVGQILDGETIREWLEPAYVYPDGTGFSYPWELLPIFNYTLHTKDGRINGYMSEIQMATQIKTGFVLLDSCDGCMFHYDIIGIMQGLLLQVSKWLRQLQPPPAVPSNPKEYIGTYTEDGGKNSVNITFASYGLALSTDESGYPALLEWIREDSFQETLQRYSGTFSCHTLHAGHIGQRIYFQRDVSGQVVSLMMPGTDYGKVYTKS